MWRRLFLAILVLVVVLSGLGWLGFRLWLGPGAERGNPDPDAPPAPVWTGEEAVRTKPEACSEPKRSELAATCPTETAPQPAPSVEAPPYRWPDGFQLPLEITFDDIPEAPPQVKAPSSPFMPIEKSAPAGHGVGVP
jgi:hypothetical protein